MNRSLASCLAALVAIAAAVGPSAAIADPAPQIHYSPAENLEAIDVGLIDSARRRIDIAAYVLTDYPVIWALRRAAQRGVQVRIVRTHPDAERYPPSAEYKAMAATPGVEIRTKRSRVYMHLKSYAIDDHLLRAGAANFSASGLKRQENDLIVIDSPPAAARFEAAFARIWSEGEKARLASE